MKHLFLVLLIWNSAYSQRTKIPIIDAKEIGKTNFLWDLKTLGKPPKTEWMKQKDSVRTVLYSSVDYKGKPTQVFAYYSNPDLIAGTTSKRKFPGVLLIHGGGGKAFKQWVKKWALQGYAAIAMDLGGKDGEGKTLQNAGPDQSNESKFDVIASGPVKDVWSYHAVASSILAHSLLLSLPEVDEKKTCVTGISWGGYLTCIVASLDTRFKAAVPVYGCGFYDESDVFGQSLNKLSISNKEKWMTFFDPAVYLPFARPKFLFLNGNKDKFYNVVPYDKTYRLVSPAQRTICIKPDMRHSHEWGWESKEIHYFFESVINAGNPVTTVTEISEKDSVISVSYKSVNAVVSAEFWYSSDSISTNESRVWNVKGGKIDPDGKVIFCKTPKEKFKYAFFYLTDKTKISVSSAFVIR